MVLALNVPGSAGAVSVGKLIRRTSPPLTNADEKSPQPTVSPTGRPHVPTSTPRVRSRIVPFDVAGEARLAPGT